MEQRWLFAFVICALSGCASASNAPSFKVGEKRASNQNYAGALACYYEAIDNEVTDPGEQDAIRSRMQEVARLESDPYLVEYSRRELEMWPNGDDAIVVEAYIHRGYGDEKLYEGARGAISSRLAEGRRIHPSLLRKLFRYEELGDAFLAGLADDAEARMNELSEAESVPASERVEKLETHAKWWGWEVPSVREKYGSKFVTAASSLIRATSNEPEALRQMLTLVRTKKGYGFGALDQYAAASSKDLVRVSLERASSPREKLEVLQALTSVPMRSDLAQSTSVRADETKSELARLELERAEDAANSGMHGLAFAHALLAKRYGAKLEGDATPAARLTPLKTKAVEEGTLEQKEIVARIMTAGRGRTFGEMSESHGSFDPAKLLNDLIVAGYLAAAFRQNQAPTQVSGELLEQIRQSYAEAIGKLVDASPKAVLEDFDKVSRQQLDGGWSALVDAANGNELTLKFEVREPAGDRSMPPTQSAPRFAALSPKATCN